MTCYAWTQLPALFCSKRYALMTTQSIFRTTLWAFAIKDFQNFHRCHWYSDLISPFQVNVTFQICNVLHVTYWVAGLLMWHCIFHSTSHEGPCLVIAVLHLGAWLQVPCMALVSSTLLLSIILGISSYNSDTSPPVLSYYSCTRSIWMTILWPQDPLVSDKMVLLSNCLLRQASLVTRYIILRQTCSFDRNALLICLKAHPYHLIAHCFIRSKCIYMW